VLGPVGVGVLGIRPAQTRDGVEEQAEEFGEAGAGVAEDDLARLDGQRSLG
jgi:hypothetical protein